MTVPEILSNEDLRRHEFPVACERIFLAHAGVCPLPRRVSEAIRQYAAQCTLSDQETLLPALQLDETRALIARLLRAHPDEVAFVGPTSLGLSYVARGLALKKNENVLIYFEDYPSNVYPWLALGEKGVQVRRLNVRELGGIRLLDIQNQVDENTRLVALASCHFVSGFRLDLNAIGEFLHKRNILFCVDGIQTLGAFPTTVEHVDFLAADAHKWMLGPCGAGILYVRKSLQEHLHPGVYGWNNVRCPNYIAQEQITFRNNARRYEAGTHNWLGLVGLHRAVELLHEFGIENIAAELLRKRAWLIPALQCKGFDVLNADVPPDNTSSIISFNRGGSDMSGLHHRLEAAGISTSLRSDRAGHRYIRLSPHFYNTDAELQRLLEFL